MGDFNRAAIQGSHVVVELDSPTVEQVRERVAKIPFNWIKKKIYDPEVLAKRIVEQRMQVFDFYDGSSVDPIGYSIVIDPSETDRHTHLSGINEPVREIENIALFPGQPGKGRGESFLNLVAREIESTGAMHVYLNTCLLYTSDAADD